MHTIWDVPSYPEFLKWVNAASMDAEEPHPDNADDVTVREALARISLDARGFRESFTTRNCWTDRTRSGADHCITLQLMSGPFDSFAGEWHIVPLGDAGCRVTLDIGFGLTGAFRLLAPVLSTVIDHTADRVVDAFCDRIATRAASPRPLE